MSQFQRHGRNDHRNKAGGSKYRGGPPATTRLPAECIFKTFYKESGYLRDEIYLGAADKAANAFSSTKPPVSQGQIRTIWGMLKAMENRIRVEKEALDADRVRQEFNESVLVAKHQTKRGVMPEVFLNFLEDHQPVATKSKEEFVGFVKYLTSILVRLKSK